MRNTVAGTKTTTITVFRRFTVTTAKTGKKKNKIRQILQKEPGNRLLFWCVPSMALILLVKVQSQVFTAKCSEPQVGISNGMDEGSGVAKFLSLRTET